MRALVEHNSDRGLEEANSNTARTPRLLIATFLVGFWAIFAVAEGASLTTYSASVGLVLTAVLCGILLVGSSGDGQWSPPFLVFIPLALFHVGRFIEPAVTGDITSIEADSLLAINPPRLCSYIALGLSAYVVGALIFIPDSSPEAGNTVNDVKMRRTFANVGSSLVILSVVLWFLMSMSAAGTTFFFLPYLSYLDATASFSVGHSYMGIAIGLPLVAQYLKGFLNKVAVAAFIGFALLAFPLGLRGEVLTPLVAAVAVYFRFTVRRPKWLLLLGAGIVLSASALARQVRQMGVGASDLASQDTSAFDAVKEMGGTANVLGLTSLWHNDNGEPLLYGMSYLAPILRYTNVILGVENIPGEQDYRLFNSAIAGRVGQIGGSILAEAHHNFGTGGLILIPLLWGVVLTAFMTRTRTPVGIAWGSLVAVLFLAHVRDASTHLPIWAVAGAIVIGIAVVISSFANNRDIGSVYLGSSRRARLSHIKGHS